MSKLNKMDPIELSLFSSRIQAVCEEMGAVLKRTAFSPNIRDRLDFSCAVFDAAGRLCAQAAHIPVHLGSMAFAMADIVESVDWQDGDMVILNDPYLGGTHLPNITLVAPVFINDRLCGFVANRAHHADVGCNTPGSMPMSTSLEDEGLVIEPQKIVHSGRLRDDLMASLLKNSRNPVSGKGDFAAQISACRCGMLRLHELVSSMQIENYLKSLSSLNDYAESLAVTGLDDIPRGRYCFSDVMDGDGQGNRDIEIRVCLTVDNKKVVVDFTGTAGQVPGNINCPLSVAAAAVYYVFYCLMPTQTPACAGTFKHIELVAPEGCLLNARRPAAVAAGNVETSTRIVDVVLGALAKAVPEKTPAASHGSMNNIAMGSATWDYYETVGGGMGASSRGRGLDGIQTHMTNTLNTPVEIVEMHYPLRISRYAFRDNSGGSGRYRGGDGLIREFEFLRDTSVTVLGERRTNRPWGLAGGASALPAITKLNGQSIAGKCHFLASRGDRLTVETAGGGGWGRA